MPNEAIMAILIPLFTGYTIVLLVMGRTIGILERLSLSYPVGAGILALLLFYQGWAGIRLNAVSTTLALTFIAVTCITAHVLLTEETSPNRKKPDENLGASLPEKIIITAIFALIAARMMAVTMIAFTFPIWAQDTLLNWSARAAAFYYDRGICLKGGDPFATSLGQAAYPPLDSLLQAWTALCTGQFDFTIIKSWVPTYLISATLAIYCHARKETTRLWSAVAALAFTTAPLLMLHGTEPYSDMLLGVYILIAISYLHQATAGPNPNRNAMIASASTVLALFTKNDAIPFAICITAAFALWFYKNRIDVPRKVRLIASYTAPYLLVMPYFAFKAIHHIGFRQSYYENITDRLTFDMGALIMTIVNIFLTADSFSPAVLIILAFTAYWITKKPKLFRPIAYPALALAGYAAFFIALYIFNEPHQYYVKIGTIFQRNFMTGYPALTLLATILMAKAWNATEDSPQKEERNIRTQDTLAKS